MRNKIRKIKGFHMGAANGNPKSLSAIRNDEKPRATISMPTPDDSILQQAGTLLSNPFDGMRALVNQTRGGIRQAFGMSDQGDRDGVYGSLSSLRRANDSEDKQTIEALSRSSALNTTSSTAMLASGVLLGAQTLVDLAQGDPTAAITKKLNKIPGVKQVIKDPIKAAKTAKGAYISYKGYKNVLK